MARSGTGDSTFGALLRRHRLAAGLTQEALAERACMSAEGISALERGHRHVPYRTTVALLARALQLSAEASGELEKAASAAPRPRAGRSAASAAPAADGERHNLPVAPTPFLGREQELAELRSLIAEQRLVTVTGAGGIGKTRAALEIGTELVARSKNGVWFVDLANISAPGGDELPVVEGRAVDRAALTSRSRVEGAIARVFDFPESSQPLLEALTAHLERRSLTIILDNCEHVVAAAATVAEVLLRTCPQVRILATSREPLRIGFERAYRLPSLSIPSAAAMSTLSAQDAAGYAAIELFTQRARAARPSFLLTRENAPVVAEICRQLDGIPLALELAAARLNVLSVHALAAKLEARFALLTGGVRTSRPRQQTMRALIDWSFDLLAPAEQRLFERLSIFAGGCDLAAVAAVHADADEVGDADEINVLELLGSLVDKSLVVADVGDVADREPRYRLLESTRAYASDKLAARGETELVARRHARTFAARAERFEREYPTASDADVARAEADLENWRAALDWALRGRGDVVLGQRIAGALRPLWSHVSFVEGRRWLSAAIDSLDDRTPSRVRAMLELGSARVSALLGEWDRAIADAQRAIVAFDELADPLNAARARRELGLGFLCSGRGPQASPLLKIALAEARAHADSRLIAKVLEELALERTQAGDLACARDCVGEALALWNALGATVNMLGAALVLGETEFLAGNVELAVEVAAQAVGVTRDQTKNRGLAPLLLNLAAYLIAVNRWDEARAAAREALGLAHETQRHIWRAFALQHIAAVAALSADVAAPNLARLRDAALIIGYVDGRIAALNSPREYTEASEYDRIGARLHSDLGVDELHALLARGASLMLDEAVGIALSL